MDVLIGFLLLQSISTSTIPQLIAAHALKANIDPTTAIVIAKCESDFNPQAKNPSSTASGVFQILDSTWERYACEGNTFDAGDNIRCSMKIAKEGFQAWSASSQCWLPLLFSYEDRGGRVL